MNTEFLGFRKINSSLKDDLIKTGTTLVDGITKTILNNVVYLADDETSTEEILKLINGNFITVTFNITEANTTITLKNLIGMTSIDWGDGAIELALPVSEHIYVNTGEYKCTIYGVTSISNSAFYGCTNLMSVVIGNSVTSINSYAFSGCRNLTNITIPDSITSIGKYTFEDCRSLTSVEIGNGVTSISDRAFEDCSGLMEVVLGNNVTSIGEKVFANCVLLTSVDFKNPTPITYTSELHWFTTTTALAYIYVPYGCVEVYKTKWAEDGATEDILSKIIESDRKAMMSDVNNLKPELDLNLQKSHGDRTISTKPRINDSGEVKEAHAYLKDSIALAYKGQAGMTAEEFAVKYPSGKDDWGHTYEQSFGIAFATGLETKALGRNSHAQNRATQAIANDSSASGVETEASGGNGSNANGFRTYATGEASFTANTNTKASGKGAAAFGNGGEAEGTYSFKTGDNNKSKGSCTLTAGANNTASGYCAYVGGINSSSGANYVFVHGEGLKTVAHNQTVFGKYNIDNINAYATSYPILTVGCGTSDTDRKDVFNVLRDGRAKVYGAPVEDEDVVRKVDLQNIGGTKLYRHKVIGRAISDESITFDIALISPFSRSLVGENTFPPLMIDSSYTPTVDRATAGIITFMGNANEVIMAYYNFDTGNISIMIGVLTGDTVTEL